MPFVLYTVVTYVCIHARLSTGRIYTVSRKIGTAHNSIRDALRAVSNNGTVRRNEILREIENASDNEISQHNMHRRQLKSIYCGRGIHRFLYQQLELHVRRPRRRRRQFLGVVADPVYIY